MKFKTAKVLRNHIECKHTDIKHKCDFENCNMEYKRKTELNAHKRIHIGLYPYPCKFPSCDKGFTCRFSLSKHMIEHQVVYDIFDASKINFVTSSDTLKTLGL